MLKGAALSAVIIAVFAASIYLVNQYYAVFSIHGAVNVNGYKYQTIEISMNITSQEGVEVFRNVARVDIKDNSGIWFKVIDSRVSGGVRIAVNGEAILESDRKNYTVGMPCLLVKDMRCYRVQVLIPGYDRPLRVEPGIHSITLVISWEADGRGAVDIRLALLNIDENTQAQIIPIGVKPSRSDDVWAVAYGSTKAYALMANRISVDAEDDGYGYIRVWAWLFQPLGENTKTFKFKLVDQRSDEVIAKLELPIEKHGTYYQVLLLIRAKPGEYKFYTIYPTDAVSHRRGAGDADRSETI